MNDNASLTIWLEALRSAVAVSSFVKLELRKPSKAAGDLKSVDGRLIAVKRELKLSFTYHHQTNDIVKNYSVEESIPLLAKLLAETFSAARLFTLTEDHMLAKQASGYSLANGPATEKKMPELAHNRAKERLIGSAGKSYLQALGLADAKGHVHKNAQDKFRQINKYVEILDGLIKQLPAREVLRIVDMGAGKGYLTFALYDHVVNGLGLRAEIIGVEFRKDLVRLCNDIALASGFTGLRFEQGTIAQHDCTGADIVIALHACDTATDDAINKAVRAGASLIVVAPCCHKQIRREMAKNATGESPLEFLMKYGTYVERISEMVTDGMRAQLMEVMGYRTNLFEFIGDAHTPKNVMIVATRLAKPKSNEETAELQNSIDQTKAQFGIGVHQLERLLGFAKN
jgi:SAM-dependent methyltransferase